MKKYLNKIILVGINFLDTNENVVEQYQTHGIIEKIEKDLLYIRRKDNSLFCIPLDEEAIHIANPGIYTERITEIKIENPDYLAKWSVFMSEDNKSTERIKEIGFEPE